ncbi:hypothetical protein BDW_05900 [Bdellovibrio bacteriovorus W]|nr:hypothetical protein BDW_05900 [Bdellovibrio bacteriovorus W]
MSSELSSPDLFDSRLRQLIEEIGLPLKRLPELFNISALETLQWWNGNLDFIPTEKHFLKLSSSLGINDNDLFRGNYDLKLAKERAHGKLEALPERYLKNQNSFVRTSEHIYKYLKLTRGDLFTNQVYSELNVTSEMYVQADLKINLTFFADLLAKLVEKGLGKDELDTLAAVIFLSLKNRPLGQEIGLSLDHHDAYQTLSKNFDYFDNNFECESKFVGKKCILTMTLPLSEHKDLIGEPHKIDLLLRYRMICTAWIPYLAGLTPIFPKSESLSKNDIVRTRYELNLRSEKISRPPLALV